MKGHQPTRGMSGEERGILKRAKHAPSTGAHWNTPARIATLIAQGRITRENSCEGKARFRTYEYAEEVRPKLEVRHNTKLVIYTCAFCGGFHCASRTEFAA